jgi:hypothetical protein
MKKFFILTVVALLGAMVGIAQAGFIDTSIVYVDPSDVHVDGGTAYLFSGELHALTDPSTITLQGAGNGVTITDVFLVLAVPGESDAPLATTANGFSGTNMGDLTAGHDVYNDVLGLGASHPNHSESFTNFTLFADQGATNFDIWVFDLDTSLSHASPVTVNFLNGPGVGTYAFALGVGSDEKLYVTPFTETGLQGPPPQVPEPSTLLLFGCGILGLCLIPRKRFNI